MRFPLRVEHNSVNGSFFFWRYVVLVALAAGPTRSRDWGRFATASVDIYELCCRPVHLTFSEPEDIPRALRPVLIFRATPFAPAFTGEPLALWPIPRPHSGPHVELL